MAPANLCHTNALNNNNNNKVHCMGAYPLLWSVEPARLLDPIKPAYNESRPDSWLKLIARTFKQLWISMLAVLVTVSTAYFINFLHYCSPYSRFYGAWKDNRGRHTDNPSGHYPIRTTGAHTSIIPPFFYAKCPFCHNLPEFILAWDRHWLKLTCISGGLVDLG